MKEVKADVSYGQENTGENFGTKLPPQHQSSDKIAPTSERSIMLKKLYDNIFLRQELSRQVTEIDFNVIETLKSLLEFDKSEDNTKKQFIEELKQKCRELQEAWDELENTKDKLQKTQAENLIWNKTSGKKKTNWQKRGQNFIVSKKLYY